MIIIASMDERMGIGGNNTIPWQLKPDLIRFQQITQNKTLVMGRKTWESILDYTKNKGLPNRNVIVLSKNSPLPIFQNDWWIGGGAEIYKLLMPQATQMHLSIISGDYHCDTFFPEKKKTAWILKKLEHQPEYNGISWRTEHWVKI